MSSVLGKPVEIDGLVYKIDQNMVREAKKKAQSLGAKLLKRGLVLGGAVGVVVASIYSQVVLIIVGALAGISGGAFAALLAAMKLSTDFKNKAVSLFLPGVMKGMDLALGKVKLELLKDIKGDVLDFGAGDGMYLNYVAKCKEQVTSVVSLEPIPQLHENIKKRANNLGIDIEVFGGYSSDLLKARGPNQFDFVIIGNVLCEVPSQRQVLKEIYAMLRPGGKVYFLEHIAHEKGTWDRFLEDFVNPVWHIFSGGCNCNRETLTSILKPPWQVHSWELHTTTPVINRHIAGLIVKPKGDSDPPQKRSQL